LEGEQVNFRAVSAKGVDKKANPPYKEGTFAFLGEVPAMVILKACPRCHGDFVVESLIDGDELVCLQCSYRTVFNLEKVERGVTQRIAPRQQVSVRHAGRIPEAVP